MIKGETALYMKIERAIYGCIESALQWYKYYTEVLQGEGFKINPYDQCIANKDISGKQCTIAWYVDDNIVSYDDNHVLERIVKLISNHFGELTVTRGK